MGKSIKWSAITILGIVILIGFYLRIESIDGTKINHPIRADAKDYFMYAYNMRHHDVYARDVATLKDPPQRVTPDAVRSPGYPLFLALFVNGPPNRIMIDKIMFWQVIISTLTLVISYFLFKSFIPLYWAGLAALLTTLSPHLIVANSYLLTESLFCFLLVLGGWLLSLFARRPSFWMAAISGLVLGAACLIRPSLQYFPLIIVIIFIFQFGRRKGARFSIALVMGFLLMLAPWFIRNLQTLNFMSDKSLQIGFLQHGMYPKFMYNNLPQSYGFPYRFDPNAGAIASSMPSVIQEITSRFRREPARHLTWYIFQKPFYYWSWNIIQGQGDVFVYPVVSSPYLSEPIFKWTHRLIYYLHWPLVLLCALGSVIVWFPVIEKKYDRNSIHTVRLVSGFLIYFTAIHMIGAPFPRYSVPLRPFQYGMAMFCLHYFYIALKSRKVEFAQCR